VNANSHQMLGDSEVAGTLTSRDGVTAWQTTDSQAVRQHNAH